MRDQDEQRFAERVKPYPIEDYEQYLPVLKRRAKAMRTVAGVWAPIGGFNLIIGIVATGMFNIGLGFGLLVAAFAAAVVAKDQRMKAALIERGYRPISITEKLDKKRHQAGRELEEKGFADQVAEVQAEAERVAEDESTQWWRQPGSLWYQTQEFINATDQVFKAREQAEFDRRMEEHVAALEAEKKERQRKNEELKAELQRLETERRIAATKRWMEEQREWDAFVEDAQMDARARKERGDWHEPPMGVRGAIPITPNFSDFRRAVQEEVEDRIGRLPAVEAYHRALAGDLEAQKRLFGLADRILGPSESVEIRSWDDERPIRRFRGRS
jgi:hypothetical protein